MIFSDIGGSRQPLEPVSRILMIVVILMAHPVRQSMRFFCRNAAIDPLVWSCVFYVFLNISLLDICDCKCPETPF